MPRDEYYEMKERAKQKAREADQAATNAKNVSQEAIAQAAENVSKEAVAQADDAIKKSKNAYGRSLSEAVERTTQYSQNSSRAAAKK